MFGVRKSDIKWIDKIESQCNKGNYNYDQIFLRDIIYPLYKDNCMIHASFNKLEGPEICHYFPMRFKDDDYKFVGEYVYEDDSRNKKRIYISISL